MKKEIKKVNSENRIQKRLARTKAGFLITFPGISGPLCPDLALFQPIESQ